MAELLTKERCICAAILLPTGEIVEGRRHSDCLMIVRKRGEHRLNIINATQGFMTSTGRFVDRQQGMEIQKASGLPSAFHKDGCYHGTTLFSEDLY